MAQRLFPLALIVLAACETLPPPEPIRIIETVKVEVPVPVKIEPPRELMEPFTFESLPVFVSPADPAATSALTADGERRLRLLIFDLLGRLGAWQTWAR